MFLGMKPQSPAITGELLSISFCRDFGHSWVPPVLQTTTTPHISPSPAGSSQQLTLILAFTSVGWAFYPSPQQFISLMSQAWEPPALSHPQGCSNLNCPAKLLPPASV